MLPTHETMANVESDLTRSLCSMQSLFWEILYLVISSCQWLHMFDNDDVRVHVINGFCTKRKLYFSHLWFTFYWLYWCRVTVGLPWDRDTSSSMDIRQATQWIYSTHLIYTTLTKRIHVKLCTSLLKQTLLSNHNLPDILRTDTLYGQTFALSQILFSFFI